MKRGSQRKRGRPPKFGRAADLISLTLPLDVIRWLEAIDDDLAWAIVKLHERTTRSRVAQMEVAQLVRFPGDRSLILVRPELFGNVPGVSLIPLSDGRAFLAMGAGQGVADLETHVAGRLADRGIDAEQRAALSRLQQLMAQWRGEGLQFEPRTIIVAHGPRSTGSPTIPSIRQAQRKAAP
jgi:hypothetical protein